MPAARLGRTRADRSRLPALRRPADGPAARSTSAQAQAIDEALCTAPRRDPGASGRGRRASSRASRSTSASCSPRSMRPRSWSSTWSSCASTRGAWSRSWSTAPASCTTASSSLRGVVRPGRSRPRGARAAPGGSRARPCTTIREAIARELLEERAAYDRRSRAALELGPGCLAVDEDATDVLVEGASNLVGRAGVQRPRADERAPAHARAEGAPGRPPRKRADGPGRPGRHRPREPGPDLSDLSVVATTYRAGDRVLGTVGVVGPTRMEYARAIALVDYLAHVLTRFLTNPGAVR